MTELFFYQCKSRVNLCLIFVPFACLELVERRLFMAIFFFLICVNLRNLRSKIFACLERGEPSRKVSFATFVVRNTVNLQNKKMQNEPNSLKQRTMNHEPLIHFYDEQRTMNNQQFTNEPNLCKTNQINNSLIYSFTHLLIHSIMQNEPNLRRGKVAHLTNEQRTMPALSNVEGNNKQLSNEPNLNQICEKKNNEQITHLNQ